MKAFTVVGVYDDNHQPYCDHVQAESPEEAVKAVFIKSTEYDLRILCVFDGEHTDVLPASSDDTGWLEEDFQLFEGELTND